MKNQDTSPKLASRLSKIMTAKPMSTTTEPKAAAGDPKKPNPMGHMNGKSSKDPKLDYYFDSYSHYGIHEEMLKDTVRTSGYRNAILQNRQLFKDKVILDIGCGTGILCLFAAEAGAKKVYGIECAHIADAAKQIVKDNGYENTIEIIRGKVEDVELPVEKVDVIISEWMGYFLLYESMLDTVLFARDKWLKPDGILMPDKSTMYLGALEDCEYKNEKVHFWDNVYNFNMSCMKDKVLNEPLVDVVEESKVTSAMVPIYTLDLYTVKKEELDFTAKVELPVLRNDYCHALVSFFEVEFTKCHRRQYFSTGPFSKPTHWKQVVFYLTEDLMISKGTSIKVDMSVRKNPDNPRDLNIDIEVGYQGPYTDSVQKRAYIMR